MTATATAMDGATRRARPSSFSIAFRVLPRERRRAIEAVYAFCRRADDAVDEAPDPLAARTALAQIARELDDVFRGPADRRLASSLAGAVSAFQLPREPFNLLLEGVGWDLEGRRYETRADLREYCRRVASSVGVLCVRIFGCAGPGCDRYAEELGIALQWTNILRDLGSDLGHGRVYLPAESLRGHSLTPEDLLSRGAVPTERIDALVRSEAAYARSCFSAAEGSLPIAERRRVLAGSIMGAVYQALLAKIEKAGARVLERRISVSGPRRAWLALRCLLRDGLFAAAGAAR